MTLLVSQLDGFNVGVNTLIDSATGAFNTGTAAAGNTVAVSGLGFQPKIVFFWWNGNTTTGDATAGGNVHGGFGAAASASARWAISVFMEDAQATTDTDRGRSTAACIMVLTTTTGVDGLMDLQSMDSDGFTLVIDDAFSASFRVQYLALGGPGIESVALGIATEPNGVTGNQDITGVGFQPNALVCASTSQLAADGAAVTGVRYCVGAADAGLNQWVMGGASDNNAAAATTKSYALSGEIFAGFVGSTTTVAAHAALAAYLSDGFRLNWLATTNEREIYYAAIKHNGFLKVGSFSATTGTGNFATTGVGFQPNNVLMCGAGRVASSAGTSSNGLKTILGTIGTSELAMSWADDHAADPTVVGTAIANTLCYRNISGTPTEDGQADYVSLDADGFTLNMTNGDPAASLVGYLAVR